MRSKSLSWWVAAALACTPAAVGAARAPWNTQRVTAVASQMLDQIGVLEEGLRAATAAAEAATEDPDREPGVGGRTVVTQDVSVLKDRVKTYLASVENGQGREETRPLFGRIRSLVDLTGSDFRRLPDFASYRVTLEQLEASVKKLARFYAEDLKVTTPPDPRDRR